MERIVGGAVRRWTAEKGQCPGGLELHPECYVPCTRQKRHRSLEVSKQQEEYVLKVKRIEELIWRFKGKRRRVEKGERGRETRSGRGLSGWGKESAL